MKFSKIVKLKLTGASNQTSQNNPYHFGLQTYKSEEHAKGLSEAVNAFKIE